MSVSKTQINDQKHILGVIRDITERKQIEESLRGSEILFRSIFEQAAVGITQTKIDGTYIQVNSQFCKITGYTPEDFKEITYKEITHPDDLALDNQLFEEMINGKRDNYVIEKRYIRKNGAVIWVNLSVSLARNDKGDPLYTIGVIEEITDRKHSEEALAKSTGELLASQKMARLGSYALDIAKEIFSTSPMLDEIYGIDKDYDHSFEGWASLIHPDDRERAIAYLQTEVIGQRIPADVEFRVIRHNDKATRVFHALGELQCDENGQPSALIGTCQDITELNLAENSLREREELFRSSFESAIAGISLVGLDGKFIRVNQTLCHILGYSKEELLKLTFNEITLDEDREIGSEYFGQMIKGKLESATFEKRYVKKKGDIIWVSESISAIHDKQGHCQYFVTYTQDISERKLAEERLHIREERYRSLVDTQNSLISRADLNGNFTFVNDAYCKAFGKTREELIGHSFLLNVLPEDREMALKAHDQLYDPPHRYTVEDRSMTTAGLRWLRWEGSVVRDNNGNIIELQGVGTDITEQKQNEIQLQDYLGKLRNTVEGTIETIALIVEARDPYTSGHQKRVADISVKIAQELGLPEEQIRGIYMAGIIHDVGKIQVPAEILSKPGKLSKLEFDLIKTHPKVGFDLLKGIEFPWPIAQVIYQHHERVDGSGYPRKLKGERILLEAKIIGIADVIEAITSHRPYRAALGMDVALGEIKRIRAPCMIRKLPNHFLK